jgi:thymidylate synthase (FAD)
MNVTLLAHTQLNEKFRSETDFYLKYQLVAADEEPVTDGQAVALSAIRTCYSPNCPSEIVNLEGEKYFGSKATDGKEGTEADRLIRHIMNSGHTSTMEHLTFTFAIEGVSRSLLAQLTRHRHFSYSVQSQRYVKLESDSKSGGFDYVVPESMKKNEADIYYQELMEKLQEAYDTLRKAGVPAEDARYILPNATTCNLVLTGNLRSILEFYSKRNPNTHAQWEIQELAERMKDEVINVEPWTRPFFEAV